MAVSYQPIWDVMCTPWMSVLAFGYKDEVSYGLQAVVQMLHGHMTRRHGAMQALGARFVTGQIQCGAHRVFCAPIILSLLPCVQPSMYATFVIDKRQQRRSSGPLSFVG